ncbi:ORF124 [Cydia pomonella granulovirus]|uniref:ORF124 n=2 Tax=Cydia pomonella granulosis virus TaxID=28289 RepID=Q91ET1_GVCPM|nr:ORF124 [Cydia pomonella granulovirus]AAK70784.1 ORF124 [Cydia pomonella granulovirus]AIU36771.1 ORF124 [Cydia pomonella granulovirus]AIU36908.1 ORF124 [Cydia pomonella granulovirus]AIU37050.1 ORF124 [Cydia pomonella granulovirus]AIU37192.1 ORF124 [Cydia pomonella granulovirus]
MILFTKEQFEQRRVAIVIDNNMQMHFKLVEVLRVLFKMCDHTYIDESHIRTFDEFPNTKYVTVSGLQSLARLSPRRVVADKLERWANNMCWKLMMTPVL